MIYKFDDKSGKKIINIMISVAPVFSILLVFIYTSWITTITALLIAAFDFYYTRKINRSNKIRIKELSVINGSVKFSFFYKSKIDLVLKEVDYDIIFNKTQVIFNNKGESYILGIANKEDMEEPENWNNLLGELATISNT